MLLTQMIMCELLERGPLTPATLADVTNIDRRSVQTALARLVQQERVRSTPTMHRGYVYSVLPGATLPLDRRGRPQAKGRR